MGDAPGHPFRGNQWTGGTLFHGTEKKTAKTILKEGFKTYAHARYPGYAEFVVGQEGFVSLTPDKALAKRYATARGTVLSSELEPSAKVVAYSDLPPEVREAAAPLVKELLRPRAEILKMVSEGKFNVQKLRADFSASVEKHVKAAGLDAVYIDRTPHQQLAELGEMRVYNPRVLRSTVKLDDFGPGRTIRVSG